ncbi:putative uncharacterized protein (fragment), partial [Rhodococcus sp. AW25M09]|uniref:HNH endonuclease signature motif containing protein n=1 Tax=Rhodococcus sp. AW25M09 TaxID=1268303 RepID=UPI0002ABDD63
APERTAATEPEPAPERTAATGTGTATGTAASTAAAPTPAPSSDTAGESPPTSANRPDSSPRPAAGTSGDDSPQRRLQSLTSAAALFCTHTPVGRGTRHSSALDLPTAGQPTNRTIHTPSGIYLGTASLAAALEAAIAADPTLGKSVERDPLTDRALTYRPDALTAAAVRLRDRHCRFPGCRRPAARCQLDHIVAFDHSNPLGGGWSTLGNLQCLCEYHHTVKTAGYWKATMLPGGAILWRSTSNTTRITLPTNGTSVPILGNDLRPHIPTQPRRSGIIAYPNPPDTEEPTSEPNPAPAVTNNSDPDLPPF